MAHNRFLQSLEDADRRALEPHLRMVAVSAGEKVIDQGEPVIAAHFPITAQFANQTRFRDGSAIETAVVGVEGLTGLAPVLAGMPCGWEVVCRTAGDAFRIEAAKLRALSQERPALLTRLLGLVDFYQAQAAQTAACNTEHRAQPRLARWLLTAHDLTEGDRLNFTQEELARLLGAQRTTVNEAASVLKSRKLIRYSRGVIRVLDRPGLEAAACECYGMLHERLAGLGLSD